MKFQKSSALMFAAAAVIAGAFGAGASQTQAAAPVFDWSVTDTNPAAGYTAAPFLTDSSAAEVKAWLLSQPSTANLAVKVNGPISTSTAQLIFGKPGSPVPYTIKYVFADFETPTSGGDVAQTQKLVNQIRSGSQNNGASGGPVTYVGEFNLAVTGPGNTSSGTGGTAPSFQAAFGSSDYGNAIPPASPAHGTNVKPMSNEAAYPGSPDFASKSQSGAPDIRSALFILPIDRVTYSTVFGAGGAYLSTTTVGQDSNATPGTYQNIPWISRFNNFGNNNLNNIGGTPAALGYQYAFQTSNQLLSRSDFSAQVLQYRLRGATSFNLFNYGNNTTLWSSVIGYTPAQEQSDALTGWNFNNSVLTGIMSRSYGFANLVNKVPGATAGAGAISSVQSGMMLSGVYDKTFSGGKKNMVLLLSNLSEQTKQVYFSQKLGGASIDLVPSTTKLDELETIAPGSHELLTFTLNSSGKAWVLSNGVDNIITGGKTYYGQQVFQSVDSNGDRSGIGVPEPTSLGLLGFAGLGMLARRRRAM